MLPRARILIVAPSWIGDAILSEPLVARLRATQADVSIDVLAPAWCAPVYARTQGVGRIIDSGLRHGRLDWARRRALAQSLSAHGYTQALILPNSWKSALVPWLARIPRRTGYTGEIRWGIVNDRRRLDRRALPRLVDRYAALAADPGATPAAATAPVLVPDRANRRRGRPRAGSSRRRRHRDPLPRRRVRPREALAAGAFRRPCAQIRRRRPRRLAAGFAERQARDRRGAGGRRRRRREPSAIFPAARTSAPRSTSCRWRRSSSATIRA